MSCQSAQRGGWALVAPAPASRVRALPQTPDASDGGLAWTTHAVRENGSDAWGTPDVGLSSTDIDRHFLCYARAVALALAAGVLHALARPWLGQAVSFLFFWPALVLASAWCGRGPGLLVLLLGAFDAAFWMPAQAPLLPDSWEPGLAAVLLYLLVGFPLVHFGARMRAHAQRALAAEERLMLAVEGTNIGLFDINLVARTVHLSPSLAKLTGVLPSDEPFALDDWLKRLPPQALGESSTLLKQKLQERSMGYERELLYTVGDDAPRWMLLRVHIVWRDGRAVHLRGASVDITDRKLMDAQLQQARAELRQQVDDLHRLHELSSRLLESGSLNSQLAMILQALADFHHTQRGLVSLIDEQDQTLHINGALGFGEQALTELRAVDASAGELACKRRQRVIVEDTESDGDLVALRGCARRLGFRAEHSTPLISERGQVLGAISVHFDTPRRPTARERTLADICARKAALFVERYRARAALEESQHRFEAVLEASAVPFTVLGPLRGPEGDIVDFSWTYLNRAAAQALQRPAGALLGRPVREALPDCWRLDPRAFAQCRVVIEQGRAREFELHLGDPVNTVFHCIASPMREAVALWFADISERKRNEQLLQEADNRKDEFLATLAHELRNPLAPIRQAAVLLNAAQASEAQRRWSLQVIERQVLHMALLLDDLLDISRITRGALSLRMGPANLAAIIDAAIETARPLIDAKQHRLHVHLPPQPVHFEADMLRISQVVANLLTNAAKYTDAYGSIELRAAAQAGEIVIEVSDSGIGIPADSLDEVFQMFTQLRAGGDRSGGGLGIGLALTRGLAELHGGQITAHSDGLGRGSTFTLRLPMRHSEVAATAMSVAGLPVAAPAARRVLIADDNRDATESLAMLLQLEGHQVCTAFDGREAVAAYSRSPADICLLDIGMPHLNGNEVAQAIRQLPGGEGAVLVAITGWGQEADRNEALAAGFDHHLTKPVDPGQLMQLLAASTERRAAAPP